MRAMIVYQVKELLLIYSGEIDEYDMPDVRACRIPKRALNHDAKAHKWLDDWMSQRKPIYDSRDGDRPPIQLPDKHDVLLVTGAI